MGGGGGVEELWFFAGALPECGVYKALWKLEEFFFCTCRHTCIQKKTPFSPASKIKQLSNVIWICICDFLFFPSGERGSFFKIQVITQRLFRGTPKWVSNTFCRS